MAREFWQSDFVPSWARRAVWYQIFPERFCNGDPGNDPELDEQLDAYPFDSTSPWELHPWTSDWYAQQPYEKASGKPWRHTVHRRRYGGDLQGILDKLDYLQDLGITALYLNPIFHAASSHKYDGASYHHVHPSFGPDPVGDLARIAGETPDDPATWIWTEADKLLLRLIDAVHQRGMRIILDGVFNHMGIGSVFFKDVVQNQQASRFRDWFKVRSWRDAAASVPFDYVGWAGVKLLPELNQDENGLTPGPRAYVFAATRRWMDPDGDGNPRDGIDGWRLDVAYCIAHPFWKAWRAHVRAINPDAYTVAEVIRPHEVCEEYLLGDEFDAVMNYNFAMAAAEFLWEGRADAATLDQDLRALREAYPPEVAYVLQNLGDSHDTARLVTLAFARDAVHYRDWPNAAEQMRTESTLVDARRPDAEAWARMRLFVLLQMTYVGAPMVYYGSEAGMWGPNDPDDRKPMVWPELQYDDEVHLPNGALRSRPDPVVFDQDLFAYYKQLIAIRKGSDALLEGDYHTLLAAGDLFAFTRTRGGGCLVVALNRSDRAQEAALEIAGEFVCLFGVGEVATGATVAADAGGRLRLTLPRMAGLILQRVG